MSLRILAGVANSIPLLGFLAGPVAAVTLRVPVEYPTIQAGIDAAASGDTVLVAPGTYVDYQTRILPPGSSWTSCAFLKDGVVVKSEGGSGVTTIEPQNMIGPQQIAVIARNLASNSTAIEGFRVDGPEALGAYAYFCGNVTFRDCVFDDFDGGPTTGGAVIVNGNASFVECEFVNCRANGAGALLQGGGLLEMTACVVRNCGNVGVYVHQPSGAPTTSAIVTGCQFLDNWSTNGGAGGMVSATVLGQTTFSDCLFMNNVNTGTGAGGLGLGAGPKTVENCVFIHNGAMGSNGQGGAINGGLSQYPLVFRGNTFVDNYKVVNTSAGGAIFVRFCTLENNIFVGSQGGAAVDAPFGFRSFECNVFYDNPLGAGVPLGGTNLEVDPEFCDRVALDLTLRSGSPCLPGGVPGCGLIGALGQGCGPVSVDSRSWGSIKGLYRLPRETRP